MLETLMAPLLYVTKTLVFEILTFPRIDWAVINTQKAVIELLLEKGADCNIKSKYGHTPLDEAITGGIYEIAVRFLLQRTQTLNFSLGNDCGQD